MMNVLDCKNDSAWLPKLVDDLHVHGFAIVSHVLSSNLIEITRKKMVDIQQKLYQKTGKSQLQRAGEFGGMLRLMMQFDPHFFEFLQLPELLCVIDHTLSETAILHTQNGLILSSDVPVVFQNTFHQDFRRYLNGYVASVTVIFTIDSFTVDNGATRLVPGTHQQAQAPTEEYLEANQVVLECPAGSMIVYDSTLWHGAGVNKTKHDRMAVAQQFTRSYIKPQLDYVRALGDECIEKLPDRTQQLLGWYTRIPVCLEEYYVSADKRLYRAGQG